MNLQRYMLNLYLMKNFDKPLGTAAKNILELFIHKTKMNVYQSWKELNIKKARSNEKIAYKNVRKTIKKLQYHNLITEVKFKNFRKPPRGAIYFKLTSLGILYLLENNIVTQKEFIDNYKNDYLFSTVLFPFITKETIGSLSRNYKVIDIIDYLKRCSMTIMTHLTQVKEYELTHPSTLFYGLTTSITKDVIIGDLSLGPKHFINILALRTNIPWLNEDYCKILEVERNRKFKITDGKNELILVIHLEEFIAKLYDNEQEILKFRLNTISDDLIKTKNRPIFTIEDFIPPGIEDYIKSTHHLLEDELKKETNKLCLRILESCKNAFVSGGGIEQMTIDILMIRQDKKFIARLEAFMNEIDNFYARFMKIDNKSFLKN